MLWVRRIQADSSVHAHNFDCGLTAVLFQSKVHAILDELRLTRLSSRRYANALRRIVSLR